MHQTKKVFFFIFQSDLSSLINYFHVQWNRVWIRFRQNKTKRKRRRRRLNRFHVLLLSVDKCYPSNKKKSDNKFTGKTVIAKWLIEFSQLYANANYCVQSFLFPFLLLRILRFFTIFISSTWIRCCFYINKFVQTHYNLFFSIKRQTHAHNQYD